MGRKFGLIALLMALIGALCFASHEANAEADPFVEEVLYSTGSTESTVLVESGRDNATFYRYLIIDDYSESPENWSQPEFNDSNWLLGAEDGNREAFERPGFRVSRRKIKSKKVGKNHTYSSRLRSR